MPKLSNGFDPPVKWVLGTKLQQELARGRWSQTALALVGHCLQTGEMALTCTTPRQTTNLVGVPMALLRTIKKAMPFELEALRDGRYTIGALHKDQVANKPPINDADIDDFVARAGVERVFDGCVRAASNGHAAAVNDNGSGYAAMPVQLSI